MKTLVINLLILLKIVTICNAQPVDKIVDYFRNMSIISFQDFLFTPEELIELCCDSLGQTKFLESLDYINKHYSNEDEKKENIVLISLVKDKIKLYQVDNTKRKESKFFLEEKLASYSIDFFIDEELVYKRIKAEQLVEYCNRCISIYIFFVYDPELCIKARSIDEKYLSSDVPFPVFYILKDCETPIEIASKIQKGLLERIKDINTPIMKKIYKQIEECDITDRCR